MKRIKSFLVCCTVLVSFTVATGCQTRDQAPYQNVGPIATKSITEDIKKSCATELKTYCDKVTFGKGRIAACLYDNHNKLSEECNQGLIDANARVEKFDQGAGYAALECKDDIDQYCSTEIAGKGRILKCLVEDNQEVVSKRCTQAIKDIGLDLEYLE